MTDAIRRNSSLMRELSSADAQLAEQALEQHEKRSSKILDAGQRELENAREDAERQLSNLVGKKEFPALRRALRDEQLKMRDLLQPPKGLGRDPSQLNATRKRKGDALLKEFGVNRDKLRKIGAGFRERVQKIAGPSAKVVPGFHTQSNLAQWMKLSPLHLTPLPWGVAPADLGPFSLFRPPFFDWPDRFEVTHTDDAGVSRQHFSEAFAGFVGHDVRMTVHGDPHAFATTTVDTRMGLIFEIPADGPLEIIVDATNATGEHNIRTTNELGWSDTLAGQTNSLSVHVLHPNLPDPFLAEMSRITNVDVSTTLHQENLIPGHHFFAHFLTASPVKAGRSVVILIGHRNVETCFCDDVSHNSLTSFHWLIKSVEVRVRP